MSLSTAFNAGEDGLPLDEEWEWEWEDSSWRKRSRLGSSSEEGRFNKNGANVDAELGKGPHEECDDLKDSQFDEYEDGEEKSLSRFHELERTVYEMRDEMKEVKAKADRFSCSEDSLRREKETLARVDVLERMMYEMRCEMKEMKAKADRFSLSEDARRHKRPRLDEESSEMEKEDLSKVDELKTKIDEMRDEMNALITKERSTNDELQAARRELLELLKDGHGSTIGIKRIGELDSKVFIDKMTLKMKRRRQIPPGDIETKGLQLCTSWQEKIEDPNWHPFHIIEDNNGKPQRLIKEDDATLVALKKEWGVEIHDAVVKALTEIREYNPSGCYIVPELWNFVEDRKATLDEVIRHVSQPYRCLKTLT